MNWNGAEVLSSWYESASSSSVNGCRDAGGGDRGLTVDRNRCGSPAEANHTHESYFFLIHHPGYYISLSLTIPMSHSCLATVPLCARPDFASWDTGLVCVSHHEPVSRSLPLSRSSSSLWDCDILSVPLRARLERAPSTTPFIWTPPEQHVLQAGDKIWIKTLQKEASDLFF